MQLFKKNSTPNLALFKKVSFSRNLGKKLPPKSKPPTPMGDGETPEKKKYNLERDM